MFFEAKTDITSVYESTCSIKIISPVHLDLEKPCPFEFGLRKFALDPVVSKKLQVLDQVYFKKIYNNWISQHL